MVFVSNCDSLENGVKDLEPTKYLPSQDDTVRSAHLVNQRISEIFIQLSCDRTKPDTLLEDLQLLGSKRRCCVRENLFLCTQMVTDLQPHAFFDF